MPSSAGTGTADAVAYPMTRAAISATENHDDEVSGPSVGGATGGGARARGIRSAMATEHARMRTANPRPSAIALGRSEAGTRMSDAPRKNRRARIVACVARVIQGVRGRSAQPSRTPPPSAT